MSPNKRLKIATLSASARSQPPPLARRHGFVGSPVAQSAPAAGAPGVGWVAAGALLHNCHDVRGADPDDPHDDSCSDKTMHQDPGDQQPRQAHLPAAHSPRVWGSAGEQSGGPAAELMRRGQQQRSCSCNCNCNLINWQSIISSGRELRAFAVAPWKPWWKRLEL